MRLEYIPFCLSLNLLLQINERLFSVEPENRTGTLGAFYNWHGLFSDSICVSHMGSVLPWGDLSLSIYPRVLVYLIDSPSVFIPSRHSKPNY
jgi:hypothetical protein